MWALRVLESIGLLSEIRVTVQITMNQWNPYIFSDLLKGMDLGQPREGHKELNGCYEQIY